MKMADGQFPKICIIGTGFSGICAAAQIQRKLNIHQFTIYEINEDVGGNWLVNTYPGCACDIQSHLYSYSFFPKPDWTKEFASQPEILEYIKLAARKYHVYEHTLFKHQVNELRWEEERHQWKVTVVNLTTNQEKEEHFDIVINGSGELRIPEIPKEFASFQKPVIHSARWDNKVTLENKTVAVIGSGATAIQLIPSIAHRVGKLLCYQRTPAWVIPSFQSTFTGFTKWTFRNVPFLRSAYRKSLFLSNEILFPVFEHGTVMSKIAHPIATWLGETHIKRQIKRDVDIRENLVPRYKFGCKRVGISNKYYRALNLEHVKVVTSNIREVRATSIFTEDGNEEDIDVIILATGFRVHDYFAPMKIFGTDGEDILKTWKDKGPSGYLGITSNSMPNLFSLLGPGSDVNHNSGIFQIECQVNWILKVIRELMTQGKSRVVVKEKAELEYMEKMALEMQKTIYGNFKCGSWFEDKKSGMITALYPKNSISYWKRTRKVDFSKFEFS